MKQYNRYFTDKGQFRAQVLTAMLTRLAVARDQLDMVLGDVAELELVVRDDPELDALIPEGTRQTIIKTISGSHDMLTSVMMLLKVKVDRENGTRGYE